MRSKAGPLIKNVYYMMSRIFSDLHRKSSLCFILNKFSIISTLLKRSIIL